MNTSELITKRIGELNDWRGEMLKRIRDLVHEVAPNITEEWKWDTPVWSQNGNVVAVGAFRDHLKINFFKGALLKDPKKLFNAGLDAKGTRAIDIHEGDNLDEAALKDLIRSAVDVNDTKPKSSSSKKAGKISNEIRRL